MISRFFLLFFPALAVSLLCAASAQATVAASNRFLLTERERQIWRSPTRAAEFNEVPHVSAQPRCENTRPPQALTTPAPLLGPAGLDARVKVSFIIGADGRVQGPLILESAGAVRDRSVLRTVRTWRYRPAMCNGAPTEAEGRIEFSRR